jgi:hypothetical protein
VGDSSALFKKNWLPLGRGLILRSHQDRTGAEVGFASETRRSNLRGIPPPKSEHAGRARIPTTSLLTSRRGIASLLAFKMIYDLINDF